MIIVILFLIFTSVWLALVAFSNDLPALAIILILISIALGFLSYGVSSYVTEKGSKIGTITKISNEGIFCHTDEGQILRGGMNDGSGNVGKAFDFTIKDKSMIKKLNDAMENMKEVKITYHKVVSAPCSSGSMGYFIDSVDIIK